VISLSSLMGFIERVFISEKQYLELTSR